MRHLLARQNLALVTCRQSAVESWEHVFLSNGLADDSYVSNRTKERGYVFPLYLYPEKVDLHDAERQLNFDPELYARLLKLAEHPDHGTPDEVAVFDYIYGVLHCPTYRNTYAEYLKADFPRIPWPNSPDEFWCVSSQGAALRNLHLMEPSAVGVSLYPFDGDGDNLVDIVGKNSYRGGKVWINKNQYFSDVPEVAWDFYIGGYQPAQKWLKDRKGRALTFDDVRHYQRIIKVLAETDRIMSEINMALDIV